MPARYRIVPEHRLVVTELEGRVTDADLFQQQDQLRRDPAFSPDLKQLVDASAVTEAAVTAEGLRSAARNTALAEGAVRAIFAHMPSHFGLARMFQLNTRGGEERIAVFRTLDEACAWLGVPASVMARDDEP